MGSMYDFVQSTAGLPFGDWKQLTCASSDENYFFGKFADTLPIVTNFSDSTSARLSELFIKPASGKMVSSEHRTVLSQICAEARESGLSVESLIVTLKNVFDQMPHAEDGVVARAELRERLIAVCIEEFYRDGERSD